MEQNLENKIYIPEEFENTVFDSLPLTKGLLSFPHDVNGLIDLYGGRANFTKKTRRKIRDFIQEIQPTKARYARVKAFNLGKIPARHPGAGFDAFVFVDEIFID